jgi:hypothetical protein
MQAPHVHVSRRWGAGARSASPPWRATWRSSARSALRALLLRAGREGKLAFQDGAVLEDFVENADDAATSAELDELNEEE